MARKVNLSRAMRTMQELFPEEYNFYPRSWILPEEFAIFLTEVGGGFLTWPGGGHFSPRGFNARALRACPACSLPLGHCRTLTSHRNPAELLRFPEEVLQVERCTQKGIKHTAVGLRSGIGATFAAAAQAGDHL